MGMARRHEERKGTALAIGNFSNELKSLYWTDAGGFLDESPRSGVGPTSLLSLTFGLFFFDADLRPASSFLANGHVEPTVQQVQKDVAYKQAPILYLNRGENRFAVAAAEGLAMPLVARGAAYADLDGDGDLDVVVVENGGPARVFVNRTDRPQAERPRQPRRNRKIQPRCDRGARHRDLRTDGPSSQQVTGGSSYLSAPEKTLTFGLGNAEKIDALEVRWPDGAVQTLRDLPGGSRLRVEQGAGSVEGSLPRHLPLMPRTHPSAKHQRYIPGRFLEKDSDVWEIPPGGGVIVEFVEDVRKAGSGLDVHDVARGAEKIPAGPEIENRVVDREGPRRGTIR